jgi:hypothetical protein
MTKDLWMSARSATSARLGLAIGVVEVATWPRCGAETFHRSPNLPAGSERRVACRPGRKWS